MKKQLCCGITMRLTVLALILCSIFLLNGCSSDKRRGTPLRAENKYPKQTNYKLKLDIISTKGSFRLGAVSESVRFSLKNIGANNLTIPDWKMHEPENIRLFFAECQPGGAARVPEDAWKESPRSMIRNSSGQYIDVPRFSFELAPNNAVLIDVPLFFLKHLKKGGTYALRGELDLDSVSAKSAPVEIIVKTKDMK